MLHPTLWILEPWRLILGAMKDYSTFEPLNGYMELFIQESGRFTMGYAFAHPVS
jgi:hypothetical protein